MKHHSVLALAIIGCMLALAVRAQTVPSIVISSPTNETPVLPGQAIQVAVSSSGITQLAVVGNGLIGATPLQAGGSSLNFTLQLPQKMAPGRYYVTAIGAGGDGSVVQSQSVSLRVQSVGVSAITLDPQLLTLFIPGDESSVQVRGTTAQGTVTMFPEDILFSSTNPSVASVDATGAVIGQGAGTAKITATLKTGTPALVASTNVRVLSSIRGDLNNDGQVDAADVSRLQTALNTPANGPNDARDLNHDGVINALDVRILVTLCTYAHCAMHP